jgi:pimeloyl-ACP methyl ester carboxylesterase
VQAGHWAIDGGAAHGIPGAVGTVATRLALFRFDASAEDLRNPSKAIGTARVREVSAATSQIEIEDGSQIDGSQTYKAVIIGISIPPLTVALKGDERACALIRRAIEASGLDGKSSPFIRETTGSLAADFLVLAQAGRYRITRPGRGDSLVPPIDNLDEIGARRTVERLEHMARWTQTAHLSNPSSSIQPGDVELTVLVESKAVPAPIQLEYTWSDGRQIAPTFQVCLINKSHRVLYGALLDLTQRFEINAGLLEGGCIRIEPGSTAWAHNGQSLSATVPDDLWQEGVIEYEDLLKLIVCTQEFDARLLEQPALDQPRQVALLPRDLGRSGTLNRTMRDLQARDVGNVETKEIDDWRTAELGFTTIRHLPTTPVPGEGASAALIQGVTLQGHSGLKASARLSTEPLAMRELAGVRFPRLLSEDPVVCVPFVFADPPGTFPGLSVLELIDNEDPSVVTPQQPLRLTVPRALEANEYVVPVAYDGEFFLPLGRGARRTKETVIRIDRLPAPVADGSSPAGAIKIFFEKVVSRKLERLASTPLLSVADVATDGTLTCVVDADLICSRVAQARRILLFVHGIVGDTRSMVPSVQLAKLATGQPLATQYDLVLAFDYDALITSIENNARSLESGMEAVGLGPDHGKTVDVVAHSTGGLLARWYIERGEGNRAVRKLVMLGTPNGGWPWPQVDDWASVVLGLGLNRLTTITWPAPVLASLAALIEARATGINHAGWTVEGLTSTSDPKIPYILLAGTASIPPPANDSAGPAWDAMIDRLITRIASENFLHNLASPILLEQPNDLAVTLTRMEALPAGRTPPCVVRPVACDHFSYFTSEAGLKALAEALAP